MRARPASALTARLAGSDAVRVVERLEASGAGVRRALVVAGLLGRGRKLGLVSRGGCGRVRRRQRESAEVGWEAAEAAVGAPLAAAITAAPIPPAAVSEAAVATAAINLRARVPSQLLKKVVGWPPVVPGGRWARCPKAGRLSVRIGPGGPVSSLARAVWTSLGKALELAGDEVPREITWMASARGRALPPEGRRRRRRHICATSTPPPRRGTSAGRCPGVEPT